MNNYEGIRIYYCVKDNLEVVASTLKEQVYKYLKDDESVVVMNVSTFNKLQKMLREQTNEK